MLQSGGILSPLCLGGVETAANLQPSTGCMKLALVLSTAHALLGPHAAVSIGACTVFPW